MLHSAFVLSTDAIRRQMQADIDRLESDAEHWFKTKPVIHGYPTGLVRLDNFTGGLVEDEAVILAGDPGGGKTSLMMQAVETSALRLVEEGNEKRMNLVISAEMSKRLLFLRSACRKAGVSSEQLRRGQVTATELDRVRAALEWLRSLPILVLDTPGLTSQHVVDAVKTLQDEEGLEFAVIAVDYIQQLFDEGAGDTQRINVIMRNLMRAKSESGACLLALSQYSRQKKKDGEPDIEHLLGSGNIGRAADQVWALHDPEVKEQWQGNDGPPAYRKDLYVLKNRNGRVGTVSLWYRPSHTAFFSSPDANVASKSGTGRPPVKLIRSGDEPPAAVSQA